MNTLLVTRHPALIEYLRQENLIDGDIQVVTHASEEDVRGQHVWGVLPHSLSVLTKSFTEVPLRLPPELRGKELSVEDLKKYAGKPITYVVRHMSEHKGDIATL